jgi:hypothetical protein
VIAGAATTATGEDRQGCQSRQQPGWGELHSIDACQAARDCSVGHKNSVLPPQSKHIAAKIVFG